MEYFGGLNKEYNDNFGHLEGDKCLVSVAKTLKKLSDGHYFAARYGGDEFVIVLPKCSIEHAIRFGENKRNKMVEINISHKFSKISSRVTLSIGISFVIPSKNVSINEFIEKGDTPLYIAKRNV
ncbi:GGDEF domain-containing protein [Clostridium sp. CM028]|uniref:GGDEF domain-containing protein n=1 Tax=Clostridium sp. CM028 TaxID=2851575 RepID=UPI001C6EA3C4|nr:GGDEF domain-containing protein [Clostridium sp. CM028]MBW9149772.1 GGDEF domain-containing protein [Clostridium sp. CM028]WLC63337.1 GGDEF domain-containing protein [Clostridium sp. CM028]